MTSPTFEVCPECGGTMKLAWIVPGIAHHPELRSFKCERCGEVVTKSVDADPPPEPNKR
jgi:hypothetical protein